MKNDEFSFFNQQLAAMVRDGIPLESALRRLCADMRQSLLRAELEKLEADLAKGTPLREAAAARQLPDLYRQMLEVGAQSNNLPAVLTMLADHYQRRHVVWTRLKGLMVYPVIVLIGSFLLSCFLALIMSKMASSVFIPGFGAFGRYLYPAANVYAAIWAAACSYRFGGGDRLCCRYHACVCDARCAGGFRPLERPAWPRSLRPWRSCSRAACRWTRPSALMEQLERGTPAGDEISHWRQRLASGLGKF